jgi:hypothetical protein
MSVTEKDIEYLKKTASKKYRKNVVIMLTIMSILYIIIGLYCIYHGNLWASSEGVNAWQVFEKLGEISPDENYSGGLLLSAEKLLVGIIWIISGLFFYLSSLLILLVIGKRNERILEYIDEHH